MQRTGSRLLAALTVNLAFTLVATTLASDISGTCSGPCELHPSIFGRIQNDVAWLDEIGGITDAMIRNISLICDTEVRHQCNVQAVRMMIKDGEVYLNSLQPNWRLGPPEFIGFLLELYETSKRHRLPDVEFAVNGNDDAASPAFDWKDRKTLQAVFHGGPFPLLAWSKSDNSFAQLVPYSGAFRCPDDSFDSLLARLDDVGRIPWAERRQVAFGRWNKFCPDYVDAMPPLPSGEAFVCPRSWLPTLTEHHGDILDVAVLGGMMHGNRVSAVPLMHQNKFRYIVSTDGWAISSKFDRYLLLGSALIKTASSRFGFYYDAIQPGEHYLLAMNASRNDILDVVDWLKAHDEEAERMALAAQRFAIRHLNKDARICYYRTMLEELGRRMRYSPDCSQRQLCLPVGRFLEFLSRKEETKATCKYQEVLLRYGTGQGTPAYEAFPDDVIRQLLAHDKYWPRDTDIAPLSHEPYFPGSRHRRQR